MIDILTRVSIFAHYRTIATLTTVCRELRDAHLWRQATLVRYPESIMNNNCEYLPDYLRYLIARTGDNMGFNNNDDGYMIENTKQVKSLPIWSITLYPRCLGRYILYCINSYEIVFSGDMNFIKKCLRQIHRDKIRNYEIYDTKYLTYVFKNITIYNYGDCSYYTPTELI